MSTMCGRTIFKNFIGTLSIPITSDLIWYIVLKTSRLNVPLNENSSWSDGLAEFAVVLDVVAVAVVSDIEIADNI
jgi:choline-glycine betaine transporter